MNFFQHQDSARRKTSILIILLAAAILCLIAITVFAVAVLGYFFQSHATSISAANAYSTSLGTHVLNLLQSETLLWIAGGVIAVVTAGSFYKLIQVSRGGRVVAEALGGKLILPDTRDADERKVLNVVEEMAIASGNPVPPVYLIEEENINAFAAGLTRRDAVIGVTRGCMNLLNRNELQGVMAHEFSHIHNGDMRLNMRLVAILHGILLIGLIGYFILRGSAYRGYSSSRRGKGAGQQAAFGLALVVIGYGGTFFGNIIKAAVSRQREFLADASAVQFTRDPTGIGGALKKIGGLHRGNGAGGSLLSSPLASEYSHMYFGQGVKIAFSGLMATHPPLGDRIKRIEPRWNGEFAAANLDAGSSSTGTGAGTQTQHAAASGFAASHINAQVIEDIGDPKPEHVEFAQNFIAGLPVVIHDATHEPFSARALIYCLLLDKVSAIREQQIQHLHDNAHPATFREMRNLHEHVDKLQREDYLILIDLCIPALKQLSATQHKVFKGNLRALIQADRKVTLFEWCLYRIVIQNVESKRHGETKTLRQLHKQVILLLNTVAVSSGSKSVNEAFNNGIRALGSGFQATAVNTSSFSLQEIDGALSALSELKPLEKPKLLKALLEIINTDNKVTATEAELFRAVADTLECPVPPLSASQSRTAN